MAGNGDHLQVEITSNSYLTGHRRMYPEQERALRRMGFVAPTADGPNWWVPVSAAEGYFGYERAARILIKAILDVYQVDPAVFGSSLGQDLLEARHSPNEWADRLRAAQSVRLEDFAEMTVGDETLHRGPKESDESFARRVMAAVRLADLPIHEWDD